MFSFFDPAADDRNEQKLASILETGVYVSPYALAAEFNQLLPEDQIEIREIAESFAIPNRQEVSEETDDQDKSCLQLGILQELDTAQLNSILAMINARKAHDTFALLDDLERRLIFIRILHGKHLAIADENFQNKLLDLSWWVDSAVKWLISMVALFGIGRWSFAWLYQRTLLESYPIIFNSLLYVGLLSLGWSTLVLYKKHITSLE